MQHATHFCSDWKPFLEYNEKAGAIWELYFYSAIFEKY